ncbi:MAG: thiamine phosphate synthase, partial [Chloroflexi bacterium]|nr:thiamine phosphate synthase [Chloroflexota bacterium]
DHVDLAIAADADGVHMGQKDLPIVEVRKLLPPDMIAGVSTALVPEALNAEASGADYIAVGSIFPTTSKETTRPAGLETLRKVKSAVSVPVVAIGGINENNVLEVVKAGADAVAVISAVVGAEDVEGKARLLVSKMKGE